MYKSFTWIESFESTKITKKFRELETLLTLKYLKVSSVLFLAICKQNDSFQLFHLNIAINTFLLLIQNASFDLNFLNIITHSKKCFKIM